MKLDLCITWSIRPVLSSKSDKKSEVNNVISCYQMDFGSTRYTVAQVVLLNNNTVT